MSHKLILACLELASKMLFYTIVFAILLMLGGNNTETAFVLAGGIFLPMFLSSVVVYTISASLGRQFFYDEDGELKLTAALAALLFVLFFAIFAYGYKLIIYNPILG